MTTLVANAIQLFHSISMRLFILFITLLTFRLSAQETWVELSDLAPTQINIGLIAMQEKISKIEEKEIKGDLENYLSKKLAPAFIGPDKRYYIIDRHHTSRALYEARVSFKKFKVDILRDLSHLSWTEFYDFLQKGHFVYLYDQGNGPQDPLTLPKFIWELTDDPYRTLAWMVREKGGFDKVDVPYLEFMWADFFRKRITLNGTTEFDLFKVLNQAIKLSKSEEANHLPGFNNLL